ncbi:MAG: Mg-protoporphyrin IX methyl transferase [Syntrophorhabdus sp. PtaU1.Bin058]|nr:MAG: Mg-protoporphyrin IX methyl transferase [Syntrophorhabdus sp. PtaU1.Bin058]
MNTNTRYEAADQKDISAPQPSAADRREFWDGRAQEFSEHAASTGYPEQFIGVMMPRRTWTVLDMGCGGGTIAVPLARKVRSITAVDFSKRMIDIVDRRCHTGGITNVKTIQGSWEDDWNSLGIGVYDVAIASRSLIGDDVKGSIAKLDRAARKAVYITTIVGSGPFDKELYESTGRTLNMGKDYIYYYAALYEMGIMANVAFIPEHYRNQWDSHEEALEDQRWMFRGMMTGEEEDKVRAYLKRRLVQVLGRWRLPYSRQCRWAVMWWTKDRRVER